MVAWETLNPSMSVSDMDLECMRCADDSVPERYWKDLYKYTVRPIEY